jgi:hypothetical protein
VPDDALIYLETQDLGKAFQAVTDNEAFRAAAKSQPDFTALNGIKVGVAVTGFESKYLKAPDGETELNLQPRFVAVAETNAWNYQAIMFAENKLGEFVNDIYGGGVELERFPRYGGDYFVWTANDGRKAYGLVIGSLIFFGNDETAIEKCVAVRKGEAESIAKNPKLPSGEFVASGYMSDAGVAQFSNVFAMQKVVGEEEALATVAALLAKLVANSFTDVTWTATQTDKGIRDDYVIGMRPDMGKALSESVMPAGTTRDVLISFVPPDARSVGLYDVKNPQVAWRSLVLAAGASTDFPQADLVAMGLLSNLLEPFGVAQPEQFLSAVDGPIVTVRFDEEGEEVAAIFKTFDAVKMRASLINDLKKQNPPKNRDEPSNGPRFKIEAIGDVYIAGEGESVDKILSRPPNSTEIPIVRLFTTARTQTASFSVSASGESGRLVGVLGQAAEDAPPIKTFYTASTEFKPDGVHRSETSPFGLIGVIIEQFAKEQ